VVPRPYQRPASRSAVKATLAAAQKKAADRTRRVKLIQALSAIAGQILAEPPAVSGMVYSQIMRWLGVLAAIGMMAPAASAQQTPQVLGGVSSTAPVEIDGTSMAPSPSWPVVDHDLIRTTTADGLILTTDQNAITLMQGTTVRVRSIAPSQIWIFVREGGLSVKAKNDDIRICVSNRLFQPSASAAGTLTLEKSGKITQSVKSGLVRELPVSACGEDLAAGSVASPPGAVAGGTASATTAAGGTAAHAGGIASAATIATAAGVSAGLATAIGVAGSTSPCTSAAGCNFNATSVTPSSP
jgi:hypothetical protein